MRLAYLHYLYGEDTALHHVRQFAAAARALGHQVEVHAINLAPPEGPAAGRSLQVRRGLKRLLGRYLHEPKELLWNLPYARKAGELLAADRPEVVLVRDHLLTASFVTVTRRLGLPLVLEVNAPAAESRLYLDEYLHLPWVPEALEGWKLRRADGVTVVSSTLRDYLVERHRLAPGKLTVVANGADLELFQPDTPPDPEIPRDGSPVVGFVGSFQKWHGADLLTCMVTEVGAARPATRFVLVGDGPELGRVRQAAAGLGDRLLATGRVPHHRVPGLVAACDLCVLPDCLFYASPLKVIEWMAAGKAVVAPRYGPLEEVIDPGVHGLLFPPGDTGALVEAVLRLVDGPDLRRDLGRAATRRARASLSWTDNARRVLAACAEARERRLLPAGQAGAGGRHPQPIELRPGGGE